MMIHTTFVPAVERKLESEDKYLHRKSMNGGSGMNNIRIIFSLISIFLGVIIISISKIIEEFAVVLGRAAYQAAAAGSFSPADYEMDLSINYGLGAVSILLGIIFLFKGVINKYIEDVRRANDEFNKKYRGNNNCEG